MLKCLFRKVFQHLFHSISVSSQKTFLFSDVLCLEVFFLSTLSFHGVRFTPETLGSIWVNEVLYKVVKILLRHVNADVAVDLTKGIFLLLQFEI